jgi:heme A synthase
MLSEALTLVAPYYNLALVTIIVVLFIKLFRTKPTRPDIFMQPWYVLFSVICVYILEAITTVLRAAGLIPLDNVYINGFFELIIVSLLVYMMLLQKEHLTKIGHA